MLMQVVFLGLTEAAICGAALSLCLFLIANCCKRFNASHVQELNHAIASVSNEFAREVDSTHGRLSESQEEDSETAVATLMLFVEYLSIIRKLQLACDLV